MPFIAAYTAPIAVTAKNLAHVSLTPLGGGWQGSPSPLLSFDLRSHYPGPFPNHSGCSLSNRFYRDKFPVPFTPLDCPPGHTRKTPRCARNGTALENGIPGGKLFSGASVGSTYRGSFGRSPLPRAGRDWWRSSVMSWGNSKAVLTLRDSQSLAEKLPAQPSTWNCIFKRQFLECG